MRHSMTKPTEWHVHPAMTQISLGICSVWSVFAVRMKKHWVLSYPLSALRRLITWWMYRLIWVLAGHTLFCFCCVQAQIEINQPLFWQIDLTNLQWQKRPLGVNEPLHDKTNKITFVHSEDSDQPGHLPSLISLRCPHEETLGPKLPIEWTAKTLIRLGKCPGWSESSLGAQIILLVVSWGSSDWIQTSWIFILQIEHKMFLIRIGYMEIYNEQVTDLLRTEETVLKLREDPVSWVGVLSFLFSSPEWKAHWWAYSIGRPLLFVFVANIFKHLLWNQISYGASMGWGNKCWFKWSRSHDQDGRYARIWWKP